MGSILGEEYNGEGRLMVVYNLSCHLTVRRIDLWLGSGDIPVAE